MRGVYSPTYSWQMGSPEIFAGCELTDILQTEGDRDIRDRLLWVVGNHSQGWPEGSFFDCLLYQGVGEGATPFPGLLHFTLDSYLIMLSVKQGGIKYHFLSLWYDSSWDWTQVSRAIGEHITTSLDHSTLSISSRLGVLNLRLQWAAEGHYP